MQKQSDTAVILAAGRGSRLKELSLEHPKPMTRVHDLSIIENLVQQLITSGLNHIVVVVGYLADKLREHLEERFSDRAELVFVENTIYDKTNNIYSLWLANDYLKEGFYLFEADVFIGDSIIQRLRESEAEDIIMIDRYNPEMEGTVVDLDANGMVRNMYLKRHQTEGFSFGDKFKTMNFYKISKHFADRYFLQKLDDHIRQGDVNSYYELIIKEAIDDGFTFQGLSAEGLKWWEVDTHEDLVTAEKLFNK